MDLSDWILKIGERKGPDQPFSPDEVARTAFPVGPKDEKGKERWRSHLRSVRAAAIGLARQRKIDVLRRGQPIDLTKPIKGLIQLRWIKPMEAS